MNYYPIRVKFAVVNVNAAAKFPPKFYASKSNISIVALYEMGNYRLKLSLSAYSNLIVIVKRKYIFEVETPPHHAI